MTNILFMFAASAAIIVVCNCVSTKIDFIETEKESNSKEDDVEVKHTIVVSTKLKNKGLHSTEPDALFLSRGTQKTKQEDSGEVPIVKAYKSVDTTLIRTPDSRYKPTQRPYIIRDEFDLYPNTAFSQWQPSSFYKNINYWNEFNRPRTNHREDTNHRQDPRRRIDDESREFYCRKCKELTNGSNRGCGQNPKSWLRESTTPKVKVDGKLAKLK
ncbi:uncharacterized protein LOC123714355 [Pieris brassicae]|uniref:Uncharacterized protein n=1 Tax=Pieris brassicae TaxID=7116 RepID=A0A9P0STV8_PIEBR|nr:uncharacterized protein LOC123714355 [Pieris brassicae]CAH3963137.1 unnamed protein product [Pieris brassicae]